MAASLEPSLSELTNIPSNPMLGGGVPNPIIDNSRTVDQLNQSARFNAENTWRKYQQFLQNKAEIFKNISDIQSLETAPEDRDYLNKKAAEVFSDILKDPSVALGGKGYDELQSKINQFKQDAVLSKQNKLDYDANQLFLARNPELQTDENNQLQSQYLQTPLGQRKSVQLQLPTVFDEKSSFEGLLKGATQPYTAIVGANGEPGEGYIETGNEVNPKALSSLWELALNGQKDKYGHSILGAVQKNYDSLPDVLKSQYEQNGGIKKYFADRGKQYLDAYFPEGSYSKTPEGNYRFGKKLTADPNYLGKERLNLEQQKLAEKTAADKANLSVKWANYGIAKKKLDNAKGEDLAGADTVINQAVGSINNGTPVNVYNQKDKTTHQELRISDPDLLKNFGSIDKDGTVTNVPDAIRYDPKTNQATLIYGRSNASGGFGTQNKPIAREIPLDQRTWLKVITKNSFPNKDIGGVNLLIEDVLQKNGNSLYNISKKTGVQPAAATTPTVKQNAPVKGVKTAKGITIPTF